MLVDQIVIVSFTKTVLFTYEIDTECIEADNVLDWIVKQTECVVLGKASRSFVQNTLKDLESFTLSFTSR